MIVTVWGHVPVAVFVDTDTREVVRVVAGDELFSCDEKMWPTTDEPREPVSPEEAVRAKEIVADPDVEWPRWEMGW